jgi:pimeloyl-ACP methyl ester carboxylesterase
MLGQIPALRRFGPVAVAAHTRDGSMAAIAVRILAAAPPRLALVGLSMGGYIAFEIMRQVITHQVITHQSAQRVAKLALLDTRGARRRAGADRTASSPDRAGARRALSRCSRPDVPELTPPALAQEIAAGIAGARLVVVPDSGHVTTLEQPAAVNQALVEWMIA